MVDAVFIVMDNLVVGMWLVLLCLSLVFLSGEAIAHKIRKRR
jgi:hypothetical protein